MKTMKYIFSISYFFIALFIFSSCQEDINYVVTSDDDYYVVVEGRITNEYKSHLIRLTRSDTYFSNASAPAADASTISIQAVNGGEEYSVSAVDTGVGYYVTEPFEGKIDEEYKLIFDYQDETYSATSLLDTVGVIDSVVVEYEYITYYNAGYYMVKMYATEPEPTGDYYIANLYLNDTLYNDRISLTTYFNDELINGKYFEGVDMYYLPQEEITQDTNYIYFELLSISREEYNFMDAFLSETSGNGSMFSGPSADVPTNVNSIDSDKRGFGFFAASAVVSAEAMLVKVHDESTNDPKYEK
jgi:hypothetical protein